MSDLFGNHIVGFPKRRLNYIKCKLLQSLNGYVTESGSSNDQSSEMPHEKTNNIPR